MKRQTQAVADAEAFRTRHAPWHPIEQKLLALRDGGVILSLRCVTCSTVYVAATPPRLRSNRVTIRT